MNRKQNEWIIEALEEHCGTGWHVTRHATLEAAERMFAVREAEHGITTIRLLKGKVVWDKTTTAT